MALSAFEHGVQEGMSGCDLPDCNYTLESDLRDFWLGVRVGQCETDEQADETIKTSFQKTKGEK